MIDYIFTVLTVNPEVWGAGGGGEHLKETIGNEGGGISGWDKNLGQGILRNLQGWPQLRIDAIADT